MRQQCKPLFDRLKDNPPAWSTIHTSIVKQIKSHVKTLPCLGIPTPNSFKIVETDASDIGYRGILKQKTSFGSPEQIVRSIQEYGTLHNVIIVLLRKRYYLLYYALANFKMIY